MVPFHDIVWEQGQKADRHLTDLISHVRPNTAEVMVSREKKRKDHRRSDQKTWKQWKTFSA